MSTFLTLSPPARHDSTPNASSSGSDSFFEARLAPPSSSEESDEPREAVNEPKTEEREHARDDQMQVGHNGGTHLFTITERSSVTTMKTLPVNTTFQRRITCAQPPPMNPNIEQLRLDFDNSLRRRQAISLDDHTLHKLHVVASEG